MAEEAIDTDYAGRPIERRSVTDADRRARRGKADAKIRTLDGRPVWVDVTGTYELRSDSRSPDRRRRVDHQWPTLGEALDQLGRDE